MDCLFNFCGLVVVVTGVGFSPTVKMAVAKFFGVNKLNYNKDLRHSTYGY